MNSNSRSRAKVARILALGTLVARATKITRAASPPLATRTLLSPAPAKVALRASERDGAPTRRRNTHHRTPLSVSDTRFTSVAARYVSGDTVLIAPQMALQLCRRAKS